MPTATEETPPLSTILPQPFEKMKIEKYQPRSQESHLLVAVRHALTLTILLLHSFSYIFAMGLFVFTAAGYEYLSSSNASMATLLSTALVLVFRHDFRRLLLPSKKQIQVEVATPKRIRLLTYNFFCRPPLVRNNDDDYKEERLAEFIKEIQDYDIIAVQEMFELFNTRPKRLISAAREIGFKYSLRGTWPSFQLKFVDSGLLILSKYPIINFDHHIFQHAAEIDQFCAKQVMYAEINVEGKSVHVFTTHMQATYGNNECGAPKSGNAFYEWGQTIIKGGPRPTAEVVRECNEARMAQIQETRAFIDHKLQHGTILGPNDVAVLMGDLNVDSRHCPDEYATVMSILSNGAAYEIFNAFEQTHGYHPITYGAMDEDERPLETTLTAPMDLRTELCLDYIFFIQTKQSSEDNRCALKIESVQLEPFFVQRPVSVPITQLSDHYGLSMDLCC